MAKKKETPVEKAEEKLQTEEPKEDELATQEKEKEDELAQLNDKYLRLMAEYDNFRKRTVREKEELATFAKAQIITPFLSVLDNLERAVLNADDSPLSQGVKLVIKQYEDIFKALGVETIKAEGEKFDPNFHNAVMHKDDDSIGEGIITKELQKGYKIGDKVIRFSMVEVAN